jgi:preprotein translocase subunit YajC
MYWILAQCSPGQQDGGGGAGLLIPMILIFVLMYFMLIRPQTKREKERKAMIAQVDKNDRVLTNGGIYGVVVNVKDQEVVLRVCENPVVKMTVHRDFIQSVVSKKGEAKE